MPDIIPTEQYREAHDRIYGPYGAEIEWKDREGHVWKVTEMADDHLENAMAMMIRQAEEIHNRECFRIAEAGDDPIIGPHGDAANDAFDQDFQQLMDMEPVEYVTTSYPPYMAMKAVLEFRQKQMEERVKDSRRIADWIDKESAEDDARIAFIAKYLHEADGADSVTHCCMGEVTIEDMTRVLRDAEAAWVKEQNE